MVRVQVMPMGQQRDADRAKQELSRGEHSDHFALYEAYRCWLAAERGGPSSMPQKPFLPRPGLAARTLNARGQS